VIILCLCIAQCLVCKLTMITLCLCIVHYASAQYLHSKFTMIILSVCIVFT
jgi:hypothetical protein